MLDRNQIIFLGNDPFTINELLKNIRGSGSATEAGRWAGLIYRSMLDLGEYDVDLIKEIDILLKEKGESAFYIQPSINNEGLIAPYPLSNYIFSDTVLSYKIDLEKLWKWINNHFLNLTIDFKYEWLSLYLSLRYNGLLDNLYIENFVKQIREWYPNYKKLPTADQINSYYDSFLKQPSFDYKKWICGNKEVPDNYEFKEDQRKSGFAKIWEKCAKLERQYKVIDITAKNI